MKNKEICRATISGAYANLPKQQQIAIAQHFYETVVGLKPIVSIYHGLSIHEDVFDSRDNVQKLFKERILGHEHLWLSEDKYKDIYNVIVSIDGDDYVNSVVKTILQSELFKNGSLAFKFSYLDVLERFCSNYPLELYKNIQQLYPEFVSSFIFAKRPSYIRAINEDKIDGLTNLVNFFSNQYNIWGFSNKFELTKKYYDCFSKNFNNSFRQIEWKKLNLEDYSFIKKWQLNNDDNLPLDKISFCETTPFIKVFLLDSAKLHNFLENKIKKIDVVSRFVSFAKNLCMYPELSLGIPFVEVEKSSLSAFKTGVFAIDVVLKNELSEKDFLMYCNKLVVYYIYYVEAEVVNSKMSTKSLIVEAYNKFNAVQLYNEIQDNFNKIIPSEKLLDDDDSGDDFKL